MKKIFAISAILLLAACKKESPEAPQTLPDKPADTAAAAPTISPAENTSGLRLEPLAESAAQGKAIFTEGGKTIIAFDTQAQKGSVKINGKVYTLKSLTFSENNYEIKGDDVLITASNGDFSETVSDCAYGTFPEIRVKAGGSEAVVKNVKVQDCPNYQ